MYIDMIIISNTCTHTLHVSGKIYNMQARTICTIQCPLRLCIKCIHSVCTGVYWKYTENTLNVYWKFIEWEVCIHIYWSMGESRSLLPKQYNRIQEWMHIRVYNWSTPLMIDQRMQILCIFTLGMQTCAQ